MNQINTEHTENPFAPVPICHKIYVTELVPFLVIITVDIDLLPVLGEICGGERGHENISSTYRFPGQQSGRTLLPGPWELFYLELLAP